MTTKRSEIIKAPVHGDQPNFTVYVEHVNCGSKRCSRCTLNGQKLNTTPHGPYYLFVRSRGGVNQRFRMSNIPMNELYLLAINTAQIPFEKSNSDVRDQIKITIADLLEHNLV